MARKIHLSSPVALAAVRSGTVKSLLVVAPIVSGVFVVTCFVVGLLPLLCFNCVFGCLYSVSLHHGEVGWSPVVRVNNIFQHIVWALGNHTLHYC